MGPGQNKIQGISQYSHQEYQEMRSKGLCFKCKLLYLPLHECPNKSLREIIAKDEEIEEGEFAETEDMETKGLEVDINEAHFSKLELSMFSVGGIQHPKTMKFRG